MKLANIFALSLTIISVGLIPALYLPQVDHQYKTYVMVTLSGVIGALMARTKIDLSTLRKTDKTEKTQKDQELIYTDSCRNCDIHKNRLQKFIQEQNEVLKQQYDSVIESVTNLKFHEDEKTGLTCIEMPAFKPINGHSDISNYPTNDRTLAVPIVAPS